MRPDKLPPVHRAYYRSMEAASEKEAFLAMDANERQTYAEHKGLAKAWSSLPQAHKTAVLEGLVQSGFPRFAVHMAWGRPADEKGLQARGRKLWLETYIRCTSGPKTNAHVYSHLECDGTSSETQVVFEKDRVIEVRDLD